jgi:sulfate permease, SulP family
MTAQTSRIAPYLRDWTVNPGVETLAGIVVSLALIPEAIGFSVVAGVPPETGLYGSVVIACVIAFVGGRAAMISAATASTAVLMGPIVREHGLGYLFTATILGVVQIVAGIVKVARLMKFVSRSVLTGFSNALAILIFIAQIPQLVHVPPITYGLIAIGLVVIYGFPYLTTAVPAPLVAIAALTLICVEFGIHVPTIADFGKLPSSLPTLSLPHVPFTFGTLSIIAPVAFALAAVGLLETLLTAKIVDDRTDSKSDKNRECIGQGVANVISSLFGGMGGCAMIGQSVINVSSGARGRLSTLVAGVFLLILLVVLHGLLAIAPAAGLTAVMIMVSINTFSWKSIAGLRTVPWQSSTVMIATVVTVVVTNDLSKGVIVGVLLSCVFFAAKVSAQVLVTKRISNDGRVHEYVVKGQVFFASAEKILEAIDVDDQAEQIVVDVTEAHFWDISAVGAADQIVLKARNHGRNVKFVGLDVESAMMFKQQKSEAVAGSTP